MIYFRLWEWVILDETLELIPVVAFPLAATVDPFNYEMLERCEVKVSRTVLR